MKTHPTDLISFIPGVIAVAIAVVALAGRLTVDALSTDWVWPTVLVGLGLLVLATAGIGRRSPTAATGEDTAGPDADADTHTGADTDADVRPDAETAPGDTSGTAAAPDSEEPSTTD